jgi:hypothetical protein
MSAEGQNAKYSARADVFRFSLTLGHRATWSALRTWPKRTETILTVRSMGIGAIVAKTVTVLRYNPTLPAWHYYEPLANLFIAASKALSG